MATADAASQVATPTAADRALAALYAYSDRVQRPGRPVLGRDREVGELFAALCRPEIANVLLLGDAGSGKSTIVYEAARRDPDRYYLELDVARMVDELPEANMLASRVKEVFDGACVAAERLNQQRKGLGLAPTNVVLFIDEVHQLQVLAPAAIEAMKPVLARSGLHHLNVIAATTYDEYNDHLKQNLPFIERFCRKDVYEPSDEVTVSILEAMAERHGAQVPLSVLHQCVELSNRYVPAAAQPRKAIGLLDEMIGRARALGAPYDSRLLAEVMEGVHGVRVSVGVDPDAMAERLKKAVLAQGNAIEAIRRRVHVCAAGLNDPGRPISSMLFTGSTGVGKALAHGETVPAMGADGVLRQVPVEGLVPGRDRPLGLDGEPHDLLGVYPQGERECLCVTVDSGRSHVVSADHVFTCVDADGEMIDLKASQMAVALAKGDPLWLPRPKAVLGSAGCPEGEALAAYADGRALREGEAPSRDWALAPAKARREFLRGAFDACGSMEGSGSRFAFDPVAWGLDWDGAWAVKEALWAEGWSTRDVHGKGPVPGVAPVAPPEAVAALFGPAARGESFDAASELRELAEAGRAPAGPDPIRVVSVTGAGSRPCTCIEVGAPGSLFLTSMFVPTHNTEVSKRMAAELFDDSRAFVRLDMTEYSQDDSVERFRDDLTSRVWERPNCVVLLDEVEKAAGVVTRLLLQVLDDGRLSDRNGRETSFQNCYVVLTTNAGAEVYKRIGAYRSDDTGEANLDDLVPLVKESLETTTADSKFPPELLGRVDAIVPFQPLSDSVKEEICRMRLEELGKRVLRSHGTELRFDDRVVKYVVDEKGDPDAAAGGARSVVQTVAGEVSSAVAERLNRPGPRPSVLRVGVEGTLASEDPRVARGDARVVCR